MGKTLRPPVAVAIGVAPRWYDKKALLVHGGWEVHEPRQSVERFAPFLENQGFAVETSASLEVYQDTEKRRARADCSLLDNGHDPGCIAQRVAGGGAGRGRSRGLARRHGGCVPSVNEYQSIVGGQWVAHPGNIIDYRLQSADPADPLMAGLSEFTMHPEQYYMHVDPSNKVLATTTFRGGHAPWIEGTVTPVVWTRHGGKSRVFYSSLGHVASDFDVPEAREIMQRGMLWAANILRRETPHGKN